MFAGLDGESLFYCLDDLPTAGVAGNTRRGIVSVCVSASVCVCVGGGKGSSVILRFFVCGMWVARGCKCMCSSHWFVNVERVS